MCTLNLVSRKPVKDHIYVLSPELKPKAKYFIEKNVLYYNKLCTILQYIDHFRHFHSKPHSARKLWNTDSSRATHIDWYKTSVILHLIFIFGFHSL